jgi:hypothetical protein
MRGGGGGSRKIVASAMNGVFVAKDDVARGNLTHAGRRDAARGLAKRQALAGTIRRRVESPGAETEPSF